MCGAMATTLGDLNAEARLDDPEFYVRNPYPIYARLRREAPVFWYESGRFWVLSKYEDIVWAELQASPPLTCSQGLNITEAVKQSRVIELREQVLDRAQQPGPASIADPPDHFRFRRLVGSS